jgi:hypothetical protein
MHEEPKPDGIPVFASPSCIFSESSSSTMTDVTRRTLLLSTAVLGTGILTASAPDATRRNPRAAVLSIPVAGTQTSRPTPQGVRRACRRRGGVRPSGL